MYISWTSHTGLFHKHTCFCLGAFIFVVITTWNTLFPIINWADLATPCHSELNTQRGLS